MLTLKDYGYECGSHRTLRNNDMELSLSLIKRNWAAEVALRTLKISYGFISSLALIILLKPFQEPIKKFLGHLRRKSAA